MKIIRNKYIPFEGFKAINIFGLLFVRGSAIIDFPTIQHETIHTKQMQELGYIPFYALYLVEFTIRLLIGIFVAKGKASQWAYRSISFEQEAYSNQLVEHYLTNRKHYSSFKYLFR